MRNVFTSAWIASLICACGGDSPSNASDASSDATAPIDVGADAAVDGPSEASTSTGIQAGFFGMGFNHAKDPWPTISFGTFRLWDTGTAWSELNTSAGVYDWTALDAWITVAQSHGVEILYTFGRTPSWISSNPNDTNCAYATFDKPGECDPPNDLAANGTGSNQSWKDFVTAIVQHVGTKVGYYEVWNEVNNYAAGAAYWTGTAQQLVRMAQDAHTIIKANNPKAVVLTPSTCNCNNGHLTNGTVKTTNPQDGMAYYLATTANGVTGASQADAVAFHPYLGSKSPEGIVSLIDQMKAKMKANAVGSLDLWDTESSWGPNRYAGADCPANDLRPPAGFSSACLAEMSAFVSRSLLLSASDGVARLAWYAWDNTSQGTLWDTADGTLQAAAAYQTTSTWLLGFTPDSPCIKTSVASPTGSFDWTCDYAGDQGTKERVVWNSAGSSSYSVPTGFKSYTDLAGTTQPTSAGATITISTAPILLR